MTVRMSLSAEEQGRFDAQIVERLQDNWDWNAVKRVHVYLPLARRREIGTWPFVRWLWAIHPGIETYVPRITNGGMEHVAVSHDTRFRPNHYKIPEPMAGRLLEPKDRLDIIITPLLAFDRQGHRVGYGGGYYDRFLAEHMKAQRVGLAYSRSVIEQGILEEPHDIKLQAVVTELEVIRF
jgi:5-formyltetrahydrofolate cyclo-ligase